MISENERLDTLLRALLRERPEYSRIAIPETIKDKRDLLRALINVRAPEEVNPEIFEVQGDYRQMQCAVGCHPKLYSDKTAVEDILKHSHDLTVDKEYVPVCPVCGGDIV